MTDPVQRAQPTGRLRRRFSRAVAGYGGPWALALLTIVVAAGLGFRLAATLDRGALNPDSVLNLELAESLYRHGEWRTSLSGDGAREAAPGAPLFYAAVYAAAGGVDPDAAGIAVALLSTLTIVVVYLLGRRLGARLPERARSATGLGSAVVVAFHPTFIDLNSRFYSETIAAFTLSAAALGVLWAAGGERPLRWVVPGVLLGLTALVRPEFLAVAALAVVFVAIWSLRRRGAKTTLAVVSVLVAATALPILPWTVRNAVVYGEFVPVSAGSGRVMFLGTWLPGEGRPRLVKQALMKRYPDLRLPSNRGRPIETPEIQRTSIEPFLDRLAEQYPDLSRDRALRKIATANLKDSVLHRPGEFSALVARKLWRMWSRPYLQVGEIGSTVLHLVLLILGLSGLTLLAVGRRWWTLAVFATPIVALTAIATLTMGDSRRVVAVMPLVVALALFAAVSGVFSASRRRRPA